MRVDGQVMTAAQRPPQTNLTRWRDRRVRDTEHRFAACQHVGIDRVGLGPARDRLAKPGRVTVLHEPDPAPRLAHRHRQRQPRPSSRLDHHQRPGVGAESFGQFRHPGQGGCDPEVLPQPGAADRDLMIGDHRGVDPDRHRWFVIVEHCHSRALPSQS